MRFKLKKRVRKRQPSNPTEFAMITEEEWIKIDKKTLSEICERLFWTPPENYRERWIHN